jgi:predicted RNA-binding Zn ribbon-like protein
MFDSHVATLLEVSVALVNGLTDGMRHGRPFTAPSGDDLSAAVGELLPSAGGGAGAVPADQAAYLAETARRMRGVFQAVADGSLDKAAADLNALLRSTGARPQLDQLGGDPWQVHFHGHDDTYAVGWSAGCATALALAIGSPLAGRLGVCAAGHCDRVYVDTSRNATRQFCSTTCQNRVKAAAFRARQTGRHN